MTLAYTPTSELAIWSEQLRRAFASSSTFQAAIPGGDFAAALERIALEGVDLERPFVVIEPGDDVGFNVSTQPAGYLEFGSFLVYIEADVDFELAALDAVSEKHRATDFFWNVLADVYALRNQPDATSPFERAHIDLRSGRMLALERSDENLDPTAGAFWFSAWDLQWGIPE